MYIQTEGNKFLSDKWRNVMTQQRSAMRSQCYKIATQIISDLKKQREDDIALIKRGIFKADNAHKIPKEMDKTNYFIIYIRFINSKFEKEWGKKTAHKSYWFGDSLQFYTNKMRRLVLMLCYNDLQTNKEDFFAKCNDDNDDDIDIEID